MSSCYVQLDNYQGSFCAGGPISGRVICSFNTPKNVREIKVKLKGEENNSWTETESYYDEHEKTHKERTIYYSGRNRFLHLESTLHGQGEISAGRYEFPFTFQLPNNIPSTYRGHYGGIYFTLEAKVNRPFKFDFTDSKQIIVASPINLNLMRNNLQLTPVSYSDDKMVGCCCCASGPITLAVHMEKEAFIVGEIAKIRIDITNLSNVTIESVNAKLMMKIISKVTSPSSRTKSNSEMIALCHDTGVGANGERTYNFDMKIPDLLSVPNFDICQLFSKTVKLKVTAVIPGFHTNLEVPVYITLGHIPVYTTSQTNIAGQYPPNAYPPPSYSTESGVPPYSAEQGPIGFVVPQGMDAGPSAPPAEGGASAPSKKEMADGDFIALNEDGTSSEPPPPSYHEAMSNITKQQ